MDILTGRSTIIRFQILSPSITEANLVISACLSRVPKLEAMIANQNTKNIIEDVFGISGSLFETMLVSASDVGTMEEGLPIEATNDLPSLFATTYIIADYGELVIEALTPPDWTDDDILYIDHQDVQPLVHVGAFRHRGIRDLHPAILNYIIFGIAECGQNFLAESGYPGYFDLISYYAEDLIDITNHLIMICIGPFKELLDKASITQRDFASYCNISWRTVEDWCTGRSNCKIYVRLLIAEQIGLMQRRKPCLYKYKQKQEN